ncbi:putative cytoplasm protein [Filobasidium floriforme]|uniref:putative cytoplasm protein n=1 Tax=Filobasidium floriforme TaxID=5210 RepID=UPI001E8CFA64|nr:putative cytoplasm protein [Filobasidium floriforme]KAH8084632.1 putative cytoplasm protein [Filobasidium floriforme]
MSSFKPFPKKPVVLVTNDDGPPSASSPNIYSFVKLLQEQLGWDVRVVIPDCQKSWVGKAYAISDIIDGKYFYPRGPDGLEGEITSEKRPLKEGETMEWILLTGTPATCANIALHNIYPGEIDLVISGPNHGRNSSSAFCLSSGTIGATLSSTLSSYPSIAISYGVVTRPVLPRCLELANETAVEVVQKLWEDWGNDGTPNAPWQYALGSGEGGHRMKGKVQLYNVNLALIEKSLEKENRKVVWTRIARNGYGSLFKTKPLDPNENRWDSAAPKDKKETLPFNNGENSAGIVTIDDEEKPAPTKSAAGKENAPQTQTPSSQTARPAGPGALPVAAKQEDTASKGSMGEKSAEEARLRFFFSPELKRLIFPEEDSLEEGTDSWALFHGAVSVTPLQASFAEAPPESFRFGSESETPATGSGEMVGQWKK